MILSASAQLDALLCFSTYFGAVLLLLMVFQNRELLLAPGLAVVVVGLVHNYIKFLICS